MSAPAALRRYGMYVAGESMSASSGATYVSRSPIDGRPWASFPDGSTEDVDRAVAAAAAAFSPGGPWRSLSATRRGRLLHRLADLVRGAAEEIAAIEVRDNGKLMKEMDAQLGVVPDWLDYYAGLADKIEGRTIPLDRPDVLNYTLREPLGVVAIITPWNSPAFLTVMAMAPALAAGNTVVIKPSEETSGSMLEIAKLLAPAGFPPGVVNVVTGGRVAGEALVANPRVAKVSFTGGSETGRAIAADAGARLAHVTLELGGKSANVVFEDADLDAAEAGVIAGIFGAAGQSCVAGSRALIQESVYEVMLARIARRAEAIVLGDPMDPATEMGPIATPGQLSKVEAFVEEAREAGGRVIVGGSRATAPHLAEGLFYRPTVIAGVHPDDRLAQEEVFGPVLSVIPFRDEREAVAIANSTAYGLAAGIWSRDIKRAHRMARQLDAGTVWVNMYRALSFNSPFGGHRASGIGVLNGIEALDGFLQTKSVWVELGEEIQDPFLLKV